VARIRDWAAVHREIYERYKAVHAQFIDPETGNLKDDLGLYLTLLRGLTFEKSLLDWCTMAEDAIVAADQRRRPTRSRRSRER
jgi:Virulence activator alpha C-term